jgi:predicted RNase H-like HicB family nuclease
MFNIQFEKEADGRWIAEIAEIPGVMAYGKDREEAARKVEILFFRVLADQLENKETGPRSIHIELATA